LYGKYFTEGYSLEGTECNVLYENYRVK